MANNPRAFDAKTREALQRAYASAAAIDQLYPALAGIEIELRFMQAGLLHSSPHKRIFLPDMKAYFGILCPDRDCSGGGFDVADGVRLAADRGGRVSGTLACHGSKGAHRCGVSLEYEVLCRPKGSGE